MLAHGNVYTDYMYTITARSKHLPQRRFHHAPTRSRELNYAWGLTPIGGGYPVIEILLLIIVGILLCAFFPNLAKGCLIGVVFLVCLLILGCILTPRHEPRSADPAPYQSPKVDPEAVKEELRACY
jgi:hypothetical protein